MLHNATHFVVMVFITCQEANYQYTYASLLYIYIYMYEPSNKLTTFYSIAPSKYDEFQLIIDSHEYDDSVT